MSKAPTRTDSGDMGEAIVLDALKQRAWNARLMPTRTHPNFDILAEKAGVLRRIQVKGKYQIGLDWIEFGRCRSDTLKRGHVYNLKDSVPPADFVICVSYRDSKAWRCFVLPIEEAERVAMDHARRYYGVPSRRTGKPRKPGQMQAYVGTESIAHRSTPDQRADILPFEDRWELLDAAGSD